jgi:ATP-dependent RNA helicase DeaD
VRERTPKPVPFAERSPAAPLKPSPKHSRRTPEGHTRLHISVGAEMGVGPGDVVGAIMGETGLPAKTVGAIDIREKHLFVDVAAEHANSIIAKLSRTRLKGNRLKVKEA